MYNYNTMTSTYTLYSNTSTMFTLGKFNLDNDIITDIDFGLTKRMKSLSAVKETRSGPIYSVEASARRDETSIEDAKLASTMEEQWVNKVVELVEQVNDKRKMEKKITK